MTKKIPKAAYVVFRGRKTGIYYTWPECQAQVDGFPKGKQRGYETVAEAEAAWAEWERKVSYKLTISSKTPTETESVARPWSDSVHPPAYWVGPPASSVRNPENVIEQNIPPPRPAPSFQDTTAFAGLPLPMFPISDPSFTKRPSNFVDLTNDSDDNESSAKRFKPEIPDLYRDVERLQAPLPVPLSVEEERQVQLSEEQDRVLKMALRRDNIFLTGAAGCGKTVTLKAILKGLRKKKKRNGKNLEVQVVAPTGIAALPLGGKTTFSFAGWSPDSLKQPIDMLMGKRKKGVVQRIQELDVLIIEEISMVENQFLERLNLLLQDAMSQPWLDPATAPYPGAIEGTPQKNTLPFGGKQVIFLGDFHQLPPVQSFQTCLQCGEPIPRKKEFICVSDGCKAQEDQAIYTESDKWAFRASVWKELKLRHVKLEQIHRQKDTRFQDILNKIRNGITLTDQEWRDLEQPKQLPKGAFAVRLMSRIAQVNSFNQKELAAIKHQPRTWEALDSAKKLFRGDENHPKVQGKIREYRDSLRDHRFQTSLTLKVGARVVLLYNLDHKRGLVNGSQGVVVGWKPATPILEKDITGDQKPWRMGLMEEFQSKGGHHEWRPLVRFANGETELIPALASASLRGPMNDQYVACRTQIPLTLAWALSIHKSQGMTLGYVEVSSKDIFESGQLYVALSRATHLEGLNITGFSREQLPMDKDVLEFYANTKWEKLQPCGRKSGKISL